ncbi:putative calmodulin-binding protein [Tieghemostelium lacteum]|uniref:Putative calmodulin-binding protein n=1 Tax=Tieghemostelium lacteum TaxID=361077 RepID=A0A151Z9J2_TIELA|nr:putative calmodulin-binding protein [Tieghemostelium lacteum]|eukprot:KYQ90544.1 putative calmodulin-binding protein [Tieghemostelium lacteum]
MQHKTFANLVIVSYIIKSFRNDTDIINLLVTCKELYSHHKSLRFINFPIEYYSKCIQMNIDVSHVPTLFKQIFLYESQHYHIFKTDLVKRLSVFKITLSPHLDRMCPDVLDKDLVPQGTHKLHIGGSFKGTVPEDILPQSLENLKFNYNFNQPFTNSRQFPSHLVKLFLGSSFDHGFPENILPQSLKKLSLPGLCVTPLSQVSMPDSITSLRLGDKYNHPIDILPKSLMVLILGNEFTYEESLMQSLPPSCTKLRTGRTYNVEFVPKGIKKLRLGYGYNIKFEPGQFPEGLKSLNVGHNYYHEMERGVFPSTLKSLFLRGDHALNLKSGMLPNLTKLHLGLHPYDPFGDGILPDTLKTLYLKSSFSRRINQFPPNLEFLSVGIHFPYECLRDVKSLKILNFSVKYYTKLKPGDLPDSLEEIIISQCAELAEGVLPNSGNLKILRVNSLYRHINLNVPPCVKHVIYFTEEDGKTYMI